MSYVHDLQQPDGQQLRDAALATLEERREVLVRRARRALLKLLLEVGVATIDDVRDLVDVPAGVNANFFGAVPLPLARLGIICQDGFAKTKRKTSHARHVAVWRLENAAAAQQWLLDNPELDQPVETTSQMDLF